MGTESEHTSLFRVVPSFVLVIHTLKGESALGSNESYGSRCCTHNRMGGWVAAKSFTVRIKLYTKKMRALCGRGAIMPKKSRSLSLIAGCCLLFFGGVVLVGGASIHGALRRTL